MTRKTRRSPSRKPAPVTLNPRTLLLAGLGAASLARQQARGTVQALVTDAAGLRDRADDVAREAGARVARLRTRARQRLAPVRARADAFARDAEQQFEATVVPVLARLGLVAPPRRKAPVRKAKTPGARKSASRRKA